MIFAWIKPLLPRSLFGRSLLILLFPVVLLQLIVGMVFIQRHFEKVTTQMTRPVAVELNYILERLDRLDDSDQEQAQALLDEYATPFGMTFRLDQDSVFSPYIRRYFYDLSGREMISALTENIDHDLSVDLTSDWRRVLLDIQTSKGVLSVSFTRDRVSATNPHQLLVLMIFASMLLTIISVLFLRNQIRPIRELARVSEAFGMGRTEEFRPAGAIEVRRAGYAFLTMRSRLERQIEQRTQMLSGVSHDLKTPLTRMKLSLAMMDESEEVTQLGRDINDMEEMLELFLDFARQDRVEATEQVNIEELLRDLVGNAARTGQNVELEFVAEPDRSRSILVRPTAIKRAVSNLLSNASKYADHCHVRAELRDLKLIIQVDDDGPGIPEDKREEALQPFVRLDPSRNQERAGVGLGLAITADIVRAHGGQLELRQSEELGGLRASITIPV